MVERAVAHIDDAVRRLVGVSRRTPVLTCSALDDLTNALLMHEELDTEEVDRLFAGVAIADLKKEPPQPQPTPVPEPVAAAEETPTPEPPGKPGLAFG